MLSSDLPISLPYSPMLATGISDVLGADMDQTPADLGSFIVPFKCEVIEAGGVVTETCAGASTTPVVDFDKRPTAGSDSSRGTADIAHLVLGTTAAGKVVYDKVAIGTVLYPGDEVVVQLATQATGTGAAGHIRPYLLVKYNPETNANLADKVETT
jgi:hypothetical protein